MGLENSEARDQVNSPLCPARDSVLYGTGSGNHGGNGIGNIL